MGEESATEMLSEYYPDFNVGRKILLLFVAQIFIAIGVLFFYWWISSTYFLGAIIGQLVVSILLVVHYIYVAKNIVKIRDKYRRKYGKLAAQYYWYRYQSYVSPVVFAAFYFSLLLYNGYNVVPEIIPQQSNFFTYALFPFYIALPLGIFIVILGFLMKRHSGGYNQIIDSYFYEMFPENSKLITTGMYQYIRNPQYLSRGVISIGFGFIANNVCAIVVGLIHLLSYCAIIPDEDKVLSSRFGGEFDIYRKRVPTVLPSFGNWRKFFKFIIVGERQVDNKK